MQNRLWTVDWVLKHGGQANPMCQLCRSQPESALHMLAQCSYSKLVWTALAGWLGVQLQTPPSNSSGQLKHWWHSMLTVGTLNHREEQVRMQKLIYVAWNLWKERCRRVFDNKTLAWSYSHDHQAGCPAMVFGLETVPRAGWDISSWGSSVICAPCTFGAFLFSFVFLVFL
jgi:hypothetical protein